VAGDQTLTDASVSRSELLADAAEVGGDLIHGVGDYRRMLDEAIVAPPGQIAARLQPRDLREMELGPGPALRNRRVTIRIGQRSQECHRVEDGIHSGGRHDARRS
jgi:hypothetical protein